MHVTGMDSSPAPSEHVGAPRRPEHATAKAVGSATHEHDSMLADGIAAIGRSIAEGAWLEALALTECLLPRAAAEAQRRNADPEWQEAVTTAVDDWRAARNDGVEWSFRHATVDAPLVVRPGTPLWNAAQQGLDLLTTLHQPAVHAE